MNLSEGERLILVMLCDIYKALEVKGAVDLENLKPLILAAEGNVAAPTVGSASDDHRDHAAVASEVSEILDMWSAVERGYKHLSVEEKRVVEVEASRSAAASVSPVSMLTARSSIAMPRTTWLK